MEPRKDTYQIVTDKILACLDAGVVPWHKPWRGGLGGQPKSLGTKKPYHGINVWLLLLAAEEKGYSSPYWVTFRQAKQLGGHVRRGEKATMIVFWKDYQKQITDDQTGETVTESHWLLRSYSVFNLDQVEGIDEKRLPKDAVVQEAELEFDPIEQCDVIIANMPNPPTITHSNQRRARYSPSSDTVHLPDKKHFEAEPEYYSVMFHELAHSTGHASRLNREKEKLAAAAFGSEDYSKEELIAEMAAAMLCGVAGIQNKTIENSAAYIDSWRRGISEDKKLVVSAATKAQRASDYILAVEQS